MAFTLTSSISCWSKSRVSHASVHPRQYELNNHYGPRSNGGNNHHDLWISIKLMVRRQHNPLISVFRRYSRLRLSIQYDNTWLRLLFRSNNKSRQSGTVSNRDRKRNRNYLYYGIIISILAIGAPAHAEEGETNNTSNPVAAATGNVTNQAVQFQNNGAPSRQVYGPNISCNGSTMTFSPFYMGNHTTPFDDEMSQQSYTVAENWGFQVNFMVPLDKRGLEQCRQMAARQEEKMQLNYELVRIDNCAKLQQKGFMLVPGSRVYHLCSDVIPIVAFKQAEKKVLQCKEPPKPWYKPWHKPNKCPLNK